ncbi:23S rRNA (pseudouridine(1915)-N(3))-methyltransferase RlmH [Roseospirillum parvum]|uniref:Ribosomal RNA large subunit methyltransferase H n=1 Tax=Roseospirillum parvum TaxID=83401 RepID=A0A1G7U5F9_9PROT|nr:23S rRNA (pseudouridine(1915)-N(3))-methyltransferase RlmH [Roseospirillum parvum]SDG42677.1 23S rRNA (pseudouridine1915-N3)-methyltransferase [Roseospirillum parvum]
MRLTLIAVGRARPGPERDLFAHYAKRLKWPLEVIEVEEKRPLPVEVRRQREAELIAARLPAGARRLILDERGRDLSSRQLAERLGAWRDQGEAHVALVIGGADGLDDSLRRQADLLLALGRATWPHMLMRSLLAEQLFRCQSILDNHPYHRD